MVNKIDKSVESQLARAFVYYCKHEIEYFVYAP
jgi:hypothetical protein